MNARPPSVSRRALAVALAGGVLALAFGSLAIIGATTFHYTTVGAEVPDATGTARP